VVASCRITREGNKVKLIDLVKSVRNAEYNPKRFAAVIMRLTKPKSTALVFESGKMVVLGAKTTNDAKLAGRKYCQIVKLCHVADTHFHDWKVSNMVAVVDCGFPVKLESLHLEHAKFSSYEPELFPGLIYRKFGPVVDPTAGGGAASSTPAPQKKTVLLIFVSGKICITGARSEAELRKVFDDMWPTINKYRKDVVLTTRPITAAKTGS